MYTKKLILCKTDEIDDDGNSITVKYSYRQHSCNTSQQSKAGNTTTSNFRRHYRKFYLDKSIEGRNTPEASSALTHQPQTTIADFWSSGSTSIVLFKRGDGVAFNPTVFVKLLINFIISNSLALRIVESISLRQLLEYCLGDIELPSCQSMMRTMLSFYIKAFRSNQSYLTRTPSRWQSALFDRRQLVCKQWGQLSWCYSPLD